ncbi:molybdopterin-guanine dinucleotide biosynthesis protein B [Natranaerobius thermophilus]|uniref:Molybdopterin-guanine dinucleotide biosynthesis protein B n=1 Tax=Natranaerobius thermophilus (strain ATCC BAA-1301 / DSM 18059 / JW/NM-WN-LF) TaxID=457570 RepID=B2A245_NATTJ|nr:molybdopterin-guanine dinucleotide biosynthesis protein B [Natranaerobius thermophilus]ACB84850.1 molybdopterin-guanine dinucleotide biosynthesis protein B [Natranaerobius thermophilus JW/NM-WN-LF]
MKPPVISIAGKSKNGKTTLICNLVTKLKEKGYQVATIKHDVHGFDIDKPGKDTWKHGEAGADTVVISSPYKMAMIEQLNQERSIEQIQEKIGDGVDIVLTEGYKRGPKPKIEVIRDKGDNIPLCSNEDNLYALACENLQEVKKMLPENLRNISVFSWDDYDGIINFIEESLVL